MYKFSFLCVRMILAPSRASETASAENAFGHSAAARVDTLSLDTPHEANAPSTTDEDEDEVDAVSPAARSRTAARSSAGGVAGNRPFLDDLLAAAAAVSPRLGARIASPRALAVDRDVEDDARHRARLARAPSTTTRRADARMTVVVVRV